MAKIRYITRLEDDGTILLPPQVLERLKWEPQDYIKIEVKKWGIVEIQKIGG